MRPLFNANEDSGDPRLFAGLAAGQTCDLFGMKEMMCAIQQDEIRAL